MATELDNEANQLPPSQIEHSTNLKNIAIMLESYQLKVISKVHHSVVSLLFPWFFLNSFLEAMYSLFLVNGFFCKTCLD